MMVRAVRVSVTMVAVAMPVAVTMLMGATRVMRPSCGGREDDGGTQKHNCENLLHDVHPFSRLIEG